ncbi:MAG: DUF2238 domain-containing protein [Patescibacteria group bacterium]|nr:DUF2238 domain-containing protein [Patescibacteria group bacterium]
MKNLKKYKLLLLINIILLVLFSFLFISRKNFEFLIYVGIIIFIMAVIWLTKNKVNYPPIVLWGLTIWAFLHMTGGGIYISGKKVYELMLFPLIGEPYNILKYDQFVHFFGFGIATILMFYLIKPFLTKDRVGKVALSIVIIMAGLGVGAFNEIVEFITTVIVPESGVGGYENTALDLVFNLLGAMVAMFYILKKEYPKKLINL